MTDVDTFDVLVRAAAGDAAWDRIDGELLARRITLREALAQQAALVRWTAAEALARLASAARVDPAFPGFVTTARARGATVEVVSSGIATVIRAALDEAGVDVPVHANDVDFSPAGWTMTFLDPSANGHDKAARVRAAREAGAATVYVGDGISDAEAALVAERRFAKRGRWLERYLSGEGVAFVPFEAFGEVEAALFP